MGVARPGVFLFRSSACSWRSWPPPRCWRSPRLTSGGPVSAAARRGSRYFASRQIDRTNVTQLQVAWTYPFGDTLFVPNVTRGVVYGRGRIGSLVAVDARSGKELWVREAMNGMTNARHQLLGERRRQGPAADLRDEQPAAGDGREDRQVDHDLRQSGRGRSARRTRRPRSGDDWGRCKRTRRASIYENLIIRWAAPRAKATCRRPEISARTACATASSSGPFTRCPAPGIRVRDLAEGRVEVHWRR